MSNNQQQSINLRLTMNDLNAILFALGERPYKEVAPVIAAIRSQADPQVQSFVQKGVPRDD